MPAKTVVLTVELYVGTVSCPGVWLCPEGDVTLAVFALGGSHRTERLPPSFPLNYKNTFYFRKTFRSCSLNNLQAALKDETIYCELVQWRCDCEAQVLAQYLGSLSDVLFPPDTCTSDGVDLLMRSTNDFPGILAPKIEVSTKVRVDEVFQDNDENKEDESKLSPLGGTTSNESNIKRQKPVCHTKLYHKNRCNLSPNRRSARNSPSSRSAERTYVSPVLQWKSSVPRISSLTDRHERVARILESSYTGIAHGNTATEREAPQWLHQHHNSGGTCVCEICRRYHQLFHVN